MSDGIYPCDPVSGIAGAGRYCFREVPEQYRPTDLWIMLLVWAVLPVVGLVISIIGTATAGDNRRKGRGFGIAGIVLASIYLCFVAVITLIVGAVSYTFTDIVNDKTEEGMQSDLYYMGSTGAPVNTEYDVSLYMIEEGYYVDLADITISNTDLDTYARSKLQTVF